MSEFIVIYNPNYYNGNGFKEAKILEELFKKNYYNFSTVRFISIYQIPNLSNFLENTKKRVVLSGGIGTLNFFINHTDHVHDYNREILYFRGDSKNSFFSDINLECGDYVELNKFLENIPYTVMGEDKQFFINSCGCGLDGSVCKRSNELSLKNRRIEYLKLLKKELLKYETSKAIINVDGHEMKFDDCLITALLNGRFYGGGLKVAPDQDRLADYLSVFAIHDVDKKKLLHEIKHADGYDITPIKDNITVLKGNEITVSYDKPKLLQLDGGSKIIETKEFTSIKKSR